MASDNPFGYGFTGLSRLPMSSGPVPQTAPAIMGQPGQAQRIQQAFAPPVRPAFMAPEANISPLLDGLKFPMARPPQTPASQPQGKPSGPITVQSAPQVAAASPQASQGSQEAQQPWKHPEGDGNANNPWMNPSALAGSGQSSLKPGEGLWSFLGSGAGDAFKNSSGPPEMSSNGVPLPEPLSFGAKGSPMSVLTGGSSPDGGSPIALLAKLFGMGF